MKSVLYVVPRPAASHRTDRVSSDSSSGLFSFRNDLELPFENERRFELLGVGNGTERMRFMFVRCRCYWTSDECNDCSEGRIQFLSRTQRLSLASSIFFAFFPHFPSPVRVLFIQRKRQGKHQCISVHADDGVVLVEGCGKWFKRWLKWLNCILCFSHKENI